MSCHWLSSRACGADEMAGSRVGAEGLQEVRAAGGASAFGWWWLGETGLLGCRLRAGTP